MGGAADSSTVTLTTSAFDLPNRLAAKREPALISGDEIHFAAIADALAEQIADLTARLDAELRAPADLGQTAVDRDLQVHRLTARMRTLRRFTLDLCLGRIVAADDAEPVYIGRLSLTDSEGRRLLVDWRTPAAAPFFAATHATPMGLVSRRRYRWTRGRISDYWDEVFTGGGLEGRVALDDQSAFIASLGSSRSPRMRDVLSTIQADQDAIIRAGSRGALVVDGGPGTGKTVVALHRAAYLIYADARLASGGGGVLFVGPHQPYLSYVADVLPSLGEESVQICTLRNLVAEGESAGVETNQDVAALKSAARLQDAVERAVGEYERPPTDGLTVDTPWAEVWLGPDDWAEAFDAAESDMTHNQARDVVWEELLDILARAHDEDIPVSALRRALAQDDELAGAFNRAWPLLDPAGVVADLFSRPDYLSRCAPWLTADEVCVLTRQDATAWTDADLPLLDAARQRIGDPDESRRRRRREAVIATEQERMSFVVDDLIAADDDGVGLVSMLRSGDVQFSLIDDAALPAPDPDLLAGPFAHIVVDEAQELSDAQWQMLLRRCPSRSFTIVGDRAQARHGFTESWQERLARVGLGSVNVAALGINYRTPSEVMVVAEPVIRSVIPNANVPTAIRDSGLPVVYGAVADARVLMDDWLRTHDDGIACVISARAAELAVRTDLAELRGSGRVRFLRPELSKGLEFDLVVLVDPDEFGEGVEGAVDRYVAMTRATQQLVILAD